MRKNRTGRLGALCLLVFSTLVLTAGLAVPASAADPPPPAGVPAGSGDLAGTERIDDWTWSSTGAICIHATRSVFALGGIGTYHGRTASGQEAVYRAQLDNQSQTLYGDGPIKVEVENTQPYYHGPYGTHGNDASCTPATIGTPIPADFRIFAADQVYRLDAGAQVPCRGQGTFRRGADLEPARWYAEWTLSEDCTVIGNDAGTPGSGIAPSGTAQTHSGVHNPCAGTCVDNFKVDYKQFLPFDGLYVAMGGPTSATIGSTVEVTTAVTDDGQPVASTPVTFSVAGPAPAQPPGGASVTDASGRASFTFTAAVAGDYTVTASVSSSGTTASGTKQVHFVPRPPPAMTVDGPQSGQTEEDVTVTATFTNGGNPVPAAPVQFDVAGPGQAMPASGGGVSDTNGKATFTFAADRAGNYTVTASGSVAGQSASGSHAVPLEIKTFGREGAITLPSAESQSSAALVDPAGRFAYFGTSTSPARVVKVDLSTFQRVAALDLSDAFFVTSAVMDPAGHYAYFAAHGFPAGTVAKVDLTTFQQVGSLAVPENDLVEAVIDPAGRYAYFGTDDQTAPVSIVKVDLATFQRVGAIVSETENQLRSGVIDPSGNYAYFGASQPASGLGAIIKVDLRSFQRVGVLLVTGSAEKQLLSAVMDPAGNFAYFGTASGSLMAAAHVVKVDLRTFSRAGALVLDLDEQRLETAVIDPAGRFAYFGTDAVAQQGPAGATPDRVVKVDLRSFERASAIVLPDDERQLHTAVIDPQGTYAYFGTYKYNGQAPDLYKPKVVKMMVSRPPVPWLVAGDDERTTPYATPLSVAAPGVLANDADTGDGDLLTATLVHDAADGSVNLKPDGSFTYTPADGFSGTDTFTYKADDGMDYSAPATVSVTVAAPPQGVQAVSGSAFGFETNVSLFGGPAAVKGGPGSTCGQAGQPVCADGQSPAVSLAPSGGDVAASDPDGNVGQYGPAYIFESHGPLTVRTQGATGPAGAVQSSASVKDISDNDPFHAGLPDGEVSSTCTATRTTLGGSSRIVNGRLVTSTHPSTGDPVTEITFPHDWAPGPNTEYRGTVNHVGDSWRIVFNEQILSPEAITVNAVHMYLLGPTAVGDMIIGQSRCGVVTAAANAAPVGNDDAYTATAGRPLTVPAAGVLANDTDADGQPLTAAKPPGIRPPATGGGTWTFPGEPAHGTLDLRPDGSFTYTPAAGYSGPDTFTYLAQDSRGKNDQATVNLTVGAAPRLGVADFDADGDTDRSVFRAGAWYTDGQAAAFFGLAGDIAVPADYDGDGDLDRAVYRDGAWLTEGQATTYFGLADDVPVPGDYDGDGDVDRAVFRASVGAWFIEGQPTAYRGSAGDFAVPGDYDGDGDTDVAVWRPSSGAWHVAGQAPQWLGLEGDVPVPGDYDGDGTTDRAVWRPASGGWHVAGQATQWLGLNGDVPVPGDYDANASTERAVWRPAVGGWHVDGKPAAYLGATGDQPLPLPAAIRRAMA